MACTNCEPCEPIYTNNGCADNVDTACVTYNGPALDCLDINPNDNLNTIIKKLTDAICFLSQGPQGYVCPNLSNLHVSNITGNGTATVSFITNGSLTTFRYILNGGSPTAITSNPFTITGLTGSSHVITVNAMTPDNTICDTMQTAFSLPVSVYWNAQDTNILPTESEILAWTNKADYPTGGTFTANFSSFNSAPKYLIFAEPSTEPAKTVYYFSDDDKGFIGADGPWASGVIIGQFRVYITNYSTQTDVLPLQFRIS